MDTFLGRQPILNEEQKTVGYELLYRSSDQQNIFPEADGSLATSSLLYHVFYDTGIKEITGGKKAFINFTRDLLISGIPEALSPEEIVIEILEDVTIDDRLIRTLVSMADSGFTLALDDFIFQKGIEALLSIASIVKIDWRANSQQEIINITEALSKYKVLLLAEKVETRREFTLARELGYKFFQGFFFAKPSILKGKSLPVTIHAWLDVLTAIQRPELDLNEVVDIINKNPSLSYQLLKIINSARYGLVRPISTVKQAVILLGEKEIRKWLSLLIMAKINANKPGEILVTASIRAKFGELIAQELHEEKLGPTVFFMGLLSLLDAYLDRPLEEILPPLPLDKRIVQALVSNSGPLAIYMKLTRAYERADYNTINICIKELGLDEETVAQLYLKAVQWTQALSGI